MERELELQPHPVRTDADRRSSSSFGTSQPTWPSQPTASSGAATGIGTKLGVDPALNAKFGQMMAGGR